MLNRDVYKAIAHPIRRDILKQLREGPKSAGDLAIAYEISKPSLSSHFSVLKETDLVFTRRNGNHIFYHLNLTVANEVLAALMDLFGLQQETDHEVEPSHI